MKTFLIVISIAITLFIVNIDHKEYNGITDLDNDPFMMMHKQNIKDMRKINNDIKEWREHAKERILEPLSEVMDTSNINYQLEELKQNTELTETKINELEEMYND